MLSSTFFQKSKISFCFSNVNRNRTGRKKKRREKFDVERLGIFFVFVQWRRFNFFDKEIIKRKDGKVFEDLKVKRKFLVKTKRSSVFLRFFESLKVIGATSSFGSGDGHLLFAIADGSLVAVNQDYEINSFPLFVKEFHLLTHSGGDTLCAVGVRRTK